MRPPFIVAATQVNERDARYPGNEQEPMRLDRDLGRAAGLKSGSVHLVQLAPGQRTSYPHCEETIEEWVFVIDGLVEAWIDGELHRMEAGDFAAFPAGTGICHTFINDSDAQVTLLVGGDADRPDNRLFYPFNPERRAQLGEAGWWHDLAYEPKGDHDGKPRKR
ncbi:MAG: Hemolysin [Myxococcales bacterium]|nr:Hemolysin [Myxococcales bacterium]